MAISILSDLFIDKPPKSSYSFDGEQIQQLLQPFEV